MSQSAKDDQPVLAPLIGGTSKAPNRRLQEEKQGSAQLTSRGDDKNPDHRAKKSNAYMDVVNRTVFTILMAYVFLGFISFGAIFGIPLVLTIATIMFSEITRINQRVRKARQLPSVVILKWNLFFVCIAYVTLYNLRDELIATIPSLHRLYEMLPFVAFCAVILNFIGFVLSLRKGMYRYQFIQLTWTTMTLMFVISQCAAQIRNIMRGMIWFLLPVFCVVNNDIWAYIFGKLFGRLKLLSLSPKKTVEGFVGAFVFTVILSFWFCGFLSYFPEMYCSPEDFRNAANARCSKNPIFVQEEVALPLWIQQLSGYRLTTMWVSVAQKHAVVLGTFASLVAPFGGFFASGLKRAFKLKDFGDLIPGHGGMTDRMDCQGIMGLFTYFYLRTYVFNSARCPKSNDIMQCAMNLSTQQKQALIQKLTDSLHS